MAEGPAQRRATLAFAALLIAAGVGLAIGPGDTIHHEIHKLNLPLVGGCCCADATHSTCAWNDHYGHPWRSHRKVGATGVVLVVAGLGSGVISFARSQRARARLKAGACVGCGYDLSGTLPAGIALCPECGRPAAI
jgi:hypothetical protein